MMEDNYFEDRIFKKLSNGIDSLEKGEYENCQFMDCDLSNLNLTGYVFSNCCFERCNLSLAQLAGTAIRDVYFKDCKMMGMRFDQCDTFGISLKFLNCSLNHSSFYKLKLKKISFIECQLQDVDFVETVLLSATFQGCDLGGAIFNKTNLEKADFRTSHNFSIDPEENSIRGAKFSQASLSGLLKKYKLIIDPLQ